MTRRDAGASGLALWVANRKVYGVDKLWKAARRAGHDLGRDQVARLMRAMAIRGVTRRRKVFTTRRDPEGLRAPDLANRNFTAERPNALWVTDLTCAPTRSGMAYVLHRRRLQPDDRRLAGRVAHTHRQGPRRPGDGESPPRCSPTRRAGAHSDELAQFTSVRFTERLDEIGAQPSIGTVADCDNALAETTKGLYKAECVCGPDAAGWDDVEHLELAALSWVAWFNETGSTATAATCHRQSSRRRSTLPTRPTTP